MDLDFITLVSGLPRSGTSLMMKMLDAGGMAVVTDSIRAADEDNPGGYYEFERVKKIDRDSGWLNEARGKAVKMISALLKHLPSDQEYRVLFMQREMAEILQSQRKMLERRGSAAGTTDDGAMASFFAGHLDQVDGWLAAQPNIRTLAVSYNELIRDARPQSERVAAFLGRSLDIDRMVSVVSQDLYRNRGPAPAGPGG